MSNLQTIELKAFVPAKDYELSKRFYPSSVLWRIAQNVE